MTEKKKNKGFLNAIERVGNKLPHPIYIFMILTLIVMIISALLSGYTFKHPGTGETETINSLLSGEGIRWIVTNIVKNFSNFPPLGMVLVMMIGLGLAEETGLLRTFLKSFIVGSSKSLVTFIIVFAGVMGNIAGSSTFVVIPPLGALVFRALDRNPLAGVAAGFAGIAAGLSANLLITPTDVLTSGITEKAAQIVSPGFEVHPAVNWYFMFISTFVLSIVGTIIIEKVVEPRLGKVKMNNVDETLNGEDLSVIKPEEKKGLRNVLITTIIYIIIILFMLIPSNGILRDPEKGTIVPSPFLKGMITILLVWFIAIAVVYGITTKSIKNSSDIERYMTKSMKGFAGFIVLCFFAAQFVEFFAYSNLGLLLSVRGAVRLESTGLVGIPLLLIFIIFTSLINFLIGSSSAKWALLAPIFVPMFMQVNFSPALIQVAYRIADSVTNCISPLEPFMPFIIILCKKYDEDSGLGTVVSMMLPLAGGFLLSWVLLLFAWYGLNLPLGPGAGLFLS